MHSFSFRIKTQVLLWMMLILAASCTSDMTVGGFMVNPSGKNVWTDTCTVRLTSMTVDSLVTNSNGMLYCGTYSDPWIGTTTATAFACFNLTTFGSANPISTGNTYPVVFDSLILSLRLEKRYYGDTLQPMTVHIHRLKELIEDIEDEQDCAYNTSTALYDTEPLASHTFNPKPHNTKPVEIRLPDTLGQELLEKIRQHDDDVSSSERFRRYFKGLALIPDISDRAVLGFPVVDTLCRMSLYYHTIMEHKTEYTIHMPVMPRYQFNNYSYDRSGSPVEGLVSSETELESSVTGNMSFVQGLAGLYTKIEFPYLNNIEETGKLCAVTNAELFLFPVRESQLDGTPLPSRITLYISDEENPVIAEGETVTGTLVRDPDKLRTHYSVAVSSFIAEELDAIGVYKRSLQLVLPDTSLFRIVFGDSRFPDERNRARLNLQYTVYDPHE